MPLHINQLWCMLSTRLLPVMPIHKHRVVNVVLFKLEFIEMKLSNRAVPLFVVIVIFVLAAIAIASPLLFPSAKAVTQSGYVLTVRLAVQALDDKFKSRIENKETGVVYNEEIPA